MGSSVTGMPAVLPGALGGGRGLSILRVWGGAVEEQEAET